MNVNSFNLSHDERVRLINRVLIVIDTRLKRSRLTSLTLHRETNYWTFIDLEITMNDNLFWCNISLIQFFSFRRRSTNLDRLCYGWIVWSWGFQGGLHCVFSTEHRCAGAVTSVGSNETKYRGSEGKPVH